MKVSNIMFNNINYLLAKPILLPATEVGKYTSFNIPMQKF